MDLRTSAVKDQCEKNKHHENPNLFIQNIARILYNMYIYICNIFAVKNKSIYRSYPNRSLKNKYTHIYLYTSGEYFTYNSKYYTLILIYCRMSRR